MGEAFSVLRAEKVTATKTGEERAIGAARIYPIYLALVAVTFRRSWDGR
jgi:hypothetical protein